MAMFGGGGRQLRGYCVVLTNIQFVHTNIKCLLEPYSTIVLELFHTVSSGGTALLHDSDVASEAA